MTIVQAIEDDIQELDKLVHTCYRGEESFKGWTTEANLLGGYRMTPELIKLQLDTPGSTIFKYINDQNQLIGCVLAEHNDAEEKMHAGMLCVQPELQSKGIGKKLMNAVEDLARSKKCKVVQIDVISARETLVAWYERQGFIRTGQKGSFPVPKVEKNDLEGIPRKPLELIVLEKPV